MDQMHFKKFYGNDFSVLSVFSGYVNAYEENPMREDLFQVTLEYMDQDRCKKKYKSLNMKLTKNLDENMFCVYGRSVDTKMCPVSNT